jgi:hypothetical protein
MSSFAKAAELSLIAPQIIALRSLRTHDRREMQRMHTEKVMAFWESAAAMGLQMAKANWSLWMMTPWQMAAAGGKVLEKGLAPVHRRAKANARRLRR